MRVLLVHCHYRSSRPSGENTNFTELQKILSASGDEVCTVERTSDRIVEGGVFSLAEAALFAPWNPFFAGQLAASVTRFKPDVVHVENTFPLISPSAYWTLSRLRVPVVAGVHNYRSWCAVATAYRGGRPCEDCLTARSVLPALVHRCYKNSLLATLPVAATIALHRQIRTYSRTADLWIANSAFLRNLLVRAGADESRAVVNHNFVADSAQRVAWEDREDKAIFIGRLEPVKGVDDLIKAWKLLGDTVPRLEIVGDGEQRQELEDLVRDTGLADRISFSGRLSHAEAMSRLARARLLVFPSRWYETFGRGILEAYSHAVPVVAAAIGAIPELIDDGTSGVLYRPADIEGLASAVRCAVKKDLRVMGENGRRIYEQRYTPEAGLGRLRGLYREAIDRHTREVTP